MVRRLNLAYACGNSVGIPIPPSSAPRHGLESLFTHCNIFKCLPWTASGGKMKPLLSVSSGVFKWDAHTPEIGEGTTLLRNEKKMKVLWLIITVSSL